MAVLRMLGHINMYIQTNRQTDKKTNRHTNRLKYLENGSPKDARTGGGCGYMLKGKSQLMKHCPRLIDRYLCRLIDKYMCIYIEIDR